MGDRLGTPSAVVKNLLFVNTSPIFKLTGSCLGHFSTWQGMSKEALKYYYWQASVIYTAF